MGSIVQFPKTRRSNLIIDSMQRQIAFFIWMVLSVSLVVTPGRAQGTAPTILFSPTNRVSFIGGSATLSVTATGAPPLSYKWVKDGAAVPRGTNRFLSMINLTITNAGNYAAIVSNPYGSTTSQVASLTLTGAPPNIYLQPVDTLLCAGVTGSILLVQAGGSPPFVYQWSRNGVELPNSNTNRLSVPGIAANLGEYFAVVSNPYGSQTSGVVRLRLGPIVLYQPTNVAVNVETAVRFTIGAETCGQASFQWRRDGVNIPQGTNQSYTISSMHWRDAGYYSVVVSDYQGSVTGAVAWVTVVEQPAAPRITQEPEDVLESTAQRVTFLVRYASAPTPSFQWRFNGVNLPGATSPNLEVSAYPTNQGGYSVVLSNEFGMVTSRVARLTLWPLPPFIDEQPVGAAVCSFNTTPPARRDIASSAATPGYTWTAPMVA